MAKTIKDTDYLFLSTRIRALEPKMLSHDRMEQMLDAKTPEDAAGVLLDCGYGEIRPLTVQTLNQALSAEQEKLYRELTFFAPDPDLIDVFKVKYDYHNVKVLLKAEAAGTDGDALLLDLGRVPVKELKEKLLSSDLTGLPPRLQEAVTEARETLGTTRDPQLSDFVLDRAYYEDMFALAEEAGSQFLTGYVRISVDAANLRSVVRAKRMDKGTEFLKSILFHGGNLDVGRILNAAGAGGSLPDLFALSPLKAAAEAGEEAVSGGRLTAFERLCDNAVNDYLKTARLVPFGEAPVVAFLAAKENEFTAIRIILTGLLAGLDGDTIRERLRDAYV